MTLAELDGERLVDFAPGNGLSEWLDHSLTRAGVRLEPVANLRTRGVRVPRDVQTHLVAP